MENLTIKEEAIRDILMGFGQHLKKKNVKVAKIVEKSNWFLTILDPNCTETITTEDVIAFSNKSNMATVNR